MAPRIINGPSELKALVGEHVGYSEWMEITQDRVNLFADATGDHQWIHVDPERAAKESPFGGPMSRPIGLQRDPANPARWSVGEQILAAV